MSTSARRVEQWALIALLGGAVAIGFAPVFARVSTAGPIPTAFWRMALALPVLWFWMHQDEQGRADAAGLKVERPHGKELGLLLLAGAFFGIDLSIWHWSIHFTSVANATLLANVAPVFVTLGAWSLYGERPTVVYTLGLVLALVGAAVLMGASIRVDKWHLLGDGLALVAAIFYGAYFLSIKGLRGRHPVARIMAWSGLAAVAFLLPVSLVSGEGFTPPDLTGWAILLGLGLFSHAGGQSLIAYAMGHLPAGFSSVTLLIQPVVAALLAWAIVGESLGLQQSLGGVIVLAGILLARAGSAKKRVPTPVSRSP